MGGGSRRYFVVCFAVLVAAAMVVSFGFAGSALATDDNSGHGDECDGYDEDNPGNSTGVNESGVENRQNNSNVHSPCDGGAGSGGTYTLFVNATNASGVPLEANVSVEDEEGAFTNGTVNGNESVGEFENGTYNVTAWSDGHEPNSTQVTIDGGNENVTIMLSPVETSAPDGGDDSDDSGETGADPGGGGGDGPGGSDGPSGGAGPVDNHDDGGADDDGRDTGAGDGAGDGSNGDAGADEGAGDGTDGDDSDGDGDDNAGGDGSDPPQEEAALVPQVLLIFLVGLIIVVGATALARRLM